MAGKRGIVIQIQGDGESAKRALEMVREQMAQTAEESQHSGGIIEEAMEKVKRVFEWIALYEGARALGEELKELVIGSLELGEAMEQASQKTGLSVATMSVLRYAAVELGADFNGLVAGVGRMGKNVADAASGNKQLAADFKAMGLNAKELAGRTDGADIAFHKFIDTLAATTVASQRNGLATDMMGKAGIEQIPVLIELSQRWNDMKTGAQNTGTYMTQEGAEALAAVNQKLNEMKQAVTGGGLAFTEGFAPAFSQTMDVIQSGKSVLSDLRDLGGEVSHALEGTAAAMYVLASAYEVLDATGSTISPNADIRKHADAEFDRAQSFIDKANQLRDLADGIPLAKKPQSSLGRFLDAPDLKVAADPFVRPNVAPDKKEHTHSDNSFLEAANALQQEQIQSAADLQKSADAIQLAELEAQHKMLLVSDQTFYQEKLRLGTSELDAEEAALKQRIAKMQALYAQQHGDKTLKPNKTGVSAEEERTQTEILRLQKQVGDLEARRAQLTSANTAEVYASNQEAQLAGLRVAAELEKESNSGLTAQIALLREEASLKAQKFTANGDNSSAAEEKALGEIEVKKLEIEEINKRIAASEESTRIAVEALNDAASKGTLAKGKAEQQINALNKQEAQTLQTLVAEYTALANQLGGDFTQKAKALQAEMDKLSRPSEKGPSQFAKELGSGFGSMIEQLANDANRGKMSVHEMALSMERDLMDLAIKLATQKWLTPALQGLFTGGSGGGGGASLGSAGLGDMGGLPMFAAGGDDPPGPQIVGEEGPEIFNPKGPGNITSNAMLQKIAGGSGGGGGRSPNITTNIINNSSNPVTARPSEVSFDSESKQFIINTILEDHASGGPTSAIGRQAS